MLRSPELPESAFKLTSAGVPGPPRGDNDPLIEIDCLPPILKFLSRASALRVDVSDLALSAGEGRVRSGN